ncbi:MAG: glycoside hydrolase family 127 protein [Clostridiales bacterium]|nr:glycoside hydrolase family 127 protein [Clostridiales bacterium]
MKLKENISFESVELVDGFWADKYRVNATASLQNIKKRFEETGRFEAMRFRYKETGIEPHLYYDSDCAKWIESVSYLMLKDRKAYAAEEKFIDELIVGMEKAQMPNGYLNPYFQQKEPDMIFKRRTDHELYGAGHLIEAAVAYHKATGKDKFLRIMEKFCDCIERAFITEKTAAFTTPGHEEIELALVALYRHTSKKKYLDMAEFFLSHRGEDDCFHDFALAEYAQDNVNPARIREAVGHAVRATYLYCAMADYAAESGDSRYLESCKAVFDDIVKHKMYITGGIGSAKTGEAFTVPYDLPNISAYSESCAAIGLLFFALRMQKFGTDSRYADTVERILYNSFLSSTSLDGRSFFYENPLEVCMKENDKEISVKPEWRFKLPPSERAEVFVCSCCPPNITRAVAKIGDVIYTKSDDCLYVNQYIASRADCDGVGKLEIETNYPVSGFVNIRAENYRLGKIAVRIPAWCNKYSVSYCEGGKTIGRAGKLDGGYLVFDASRDFTLEIDFCIEPTLYACSPLVRDNSGRVALMYGPIVYCLEEIDNFPDLNSVKIAADTAFVSCYDKALRQMTFECKALRDADTGKLYFAANERKEEEVTLKFIPYYAFANRGKSDMLVWIRQK